ncbi:hypothetical protein F5Y13DRAFT_172178 [Hypoxylon sp. FL1857]|nr:hypothetical protein F5Y13DRAFT_172178 [Hypoxylon sp. FL1857]
MSSKELLGDLVATLLKKARRSMGAKSEKSDQPIPQGATTIEDKNSHCEKGAEISLSRPPSYRTIASNDELLTPEVTTAPNRGLEVTESCVLDLATSCFPPLPPDSILSPLPKPVLIPRVNPGPQIPFTRAWAPELTGHEITREDFTAFVDNLNIIIRPHPAIHVVKLAAFAIGFIPYEGADGIASALEVAADLATIVMAHTRSKKYLGLMNEKYFHPRKLHAKIVGSKQVMKMFNLNKKDPMVAPLNEDSLNLSLRERCLKYLSQWVCELSFDDIPPPSRQTNMLARMAAWEVRHKMAKADKKARRSRERAWKRHLKGKKLKESRLEMRRVKSLDWILIQNLDEWEVVKAKKQAERGKKRNLSWQTIH